MGVGEIADKAQSVMLIVCLAALATFVGCAACGGVAMLAVLH